MDEINELNLQRVINPMKLGGISPNIIHELSGVYPNFVKAFKEVITNSYDADATNVNIIVSPDYRSIIIQDNGRGMSPFEFQDEYLRIGSTINTRQHDRTETGRLRIGSKGIGFLALARYCKSIEILSHTNKTFDFNFVIGTNSQKIITNDIFTKIYFIEITVSKDIIEFTVINEVRIGKNIVVESDFSQEGDVIVIRREIWDIYIQNCNEEIPSCETLVSISFSINCNPFNFQAIINYERILNLEKEKNLEKLLDFANVSVNRTNNKDSHFTQITLSIHEFIQEELRSSKKQGRVRNIASSSGMERFIWHLSRSLPISYHPNTDKLVNELKINGIDTFIHPLPFEVNIEYSGKLQEILYRPFLSEIFSQNNTNSIFTIYPISVKTDHLCVVGYLIGFQQPIFPAEFRGIAIRVRGVEVGKPSFWGAENELPVKHRPLLDHVIGELVVTEGIDAVGTIMAGREGFYSESHQFQILKQIIIGDGTLNFGPLGEVLEKIYEKISSETSVMRTVQENKQRREAFLSISKALSEMAVLSKYGRLIRQLFSRNDVRANGLSKTTMYEIGAPQRIGKLLVEISPLVGKEYEINDDSCVVKINSNLGIWEKSLYMFGREFEIRLQNGESDDPLCELDLLVNRIYINWMHPSRGKLGDANFIKSALSWKIAYLASGGDIDIMMNIAYRLLQ